MPPNTRLSSIFLHYWIMSSVLYFRVRVLVCFASSGSVFDTWRSCIWAKPSSLWYLLNTLHKVMTKSFGFPQILSIQSHNSQIAKPFLCMFVLIWMHFSLGFQIIDDKMSTKFQNIRKSLHNICRRLNLYFLYQNSFRFAPLTCGVGRGMCCVATWWYIFVECSKHAKYFPEILNTLDVV